MSFTGSVRIHISRCVDFRFSAPRQPPAFSRRIGARGVRQPRPGEDQGRAERRGPDPRARSSREHQAGRQFSINRRPDFEVAASPPFLRRSARGVYRLAPHGPRWTGPFQASSLTRRDLSTAAGQTDDPRYDPARHRSPLVPSDARLARRDRVAWAADVGCTSLHPDHQPPHPLRIYRRSADALDVERMLAFIPILGRECGEVIPAHRQGPTPFRRADARMRVSGNRKGFSRAGRYSGCGAV
jgi:hypothetical protein